MIQSFIRGLLGPSLAPLLDFINSNPIIIGVILFIFVAFYAAGRIQLHNIFLKTQTFVLERSKKELQLKPNISADNLYKIIYPDWALKINQWALFIPHRLDLWPVRVNPENVKVKLAFSPAWIAALLKAHQIELEKTKTSENKS